MHTLKTLVIIFGIFLSTLISGCNGKSEDEGDKPESGKGMIPKATPVEAMIIRKENVVYNLSLTGILQPYHAVDIVAEVSGKVQQVFKELGDRVTTSDTLAIIDDKIPLSNYRQAQAQLLSAENNLKIARLNLKSDAELHQSGDISDLAYENSKLAVKTAEANLLLAEATLSQMEKAYRDTRIMSPIDGVIARKYIDPGMMVNPNMPVYRCVDLHKLKMMVGIPQDEIRRVRIGTPVKIQISALNNKIVDGAVQHISPQADENTGSFNIEVQIPNSDGQIRAGMTAKADILLSSMDNQLVIPEYALVTKDDKQAVYKISNHKAHLTTLAIEDIVGPKIIIASGLAEGDTIVTVGMKNLGIATPVSIESIH